MPTDRPETPRRPRPLARGIGSAPPRRPALASLRRLVRWVGALATLAVLVSATPWELTRSTPAPRIHRGVMAEHGRHDDEHDHGGTGEQAPCDDGCLCPMGGGVAVPPQEATRAAALQLPPVSLQPATPARILRSLDVHRRVYHPPRQG